MFGACGAFMVSHICYSYRQVSLQVKPTGCHQGKLHWMLSVLPIKEDISRQSVVVHFASAITWVLHGLMM
eukprot:6476272-Amphidinium_carterae.1